MAIYRNIFLFYLMILLANCSRSQFPLDIAAAAGLEDESNSSITAVQRLSLFLVQSKLDVRFLWLQLRPQPVPEWSRFLASLTGTNPSLIINDMHLSAATVVLVGAQTKEATSSSWIKQQFVRELERDPDYKRLGSAEKEEIGRYLTFYFPHINLVRVESCENHRPPAVLYFLSFRNERGDLMACALAAWNRSTSSVDLISCEIANEP